MENDNSKVSPKKSSFVESIKKYGYYIALAVLILVLAVAIVLTSVNANEPQTEPTNAGAIRFTSPVLNGTIAKNYSDTELQYNKTLNVWELHTGVDFVADIGTNVLAVADGTISNISKNLLEGTVVEIDHGNGLKTTYGSLDSNLSVKLGDVVKQGDIIGKASNTATGEVSESGQVHFEVWKDGNVINPANYLDISSDK